MTTNVRVPRRFAEDSLFQLGMRFVGRGARSDVSQFATRRCRELLSVVPKAERSWALRWLAAGVQFARQEQALLGRAA